MAKKSFKAGKWHHTATNRRNVLRSGAGRGGGRYWRNKLKNERRKTKRKARRFINDLLLFLLFGAILAGVFWLGMRKW